MDIPERTARAKRAEILYFYANRFARRQVDAVLPAGTRRLSFRSCDEELEQLEQITMKAQMTYVEDAESQIEDAEYSETIKDEG